MPGEQCLTALYPSPKTYLKKDTFILFACKYMCHMYAWKSEEGIGSSGTGVVETCEPIRGSLEINLGTLKNQEILLTTELSLQLQVFVRQY